MAKLVRRLLSEGHRVTAVYHQDENAREQCVQELATAGLEATFERIPLQRVGTAEEVAGMVSMLCHDNAAYITGQCLSIDGGLT